MNRKQCGTQPRGARGVTGAIRATLAGLALSSVALGHDLVQPPFRGLPGSTFQNWGFNTPVMGAPDGPCPTNNPSGVPSASNAGSVWLPAFAGLNGIRCLKAGDSIIKTIPNSFDPFNEKSVWIQVTFHRHNGSDLGVTIAPAPIGPCVTVDLPVPGKGPNWVHRTIACCLASCPAQEVVTLTALFDHVDVDQVVIDTFCGGDCIFPHPPIAPNDYDGDGVADPCDNAPGVFNPMQQDCDDDGIGDPSDVWELCPPATPLEAEACGADSNGGCNSPGTPTEPILCNGDVCGMSWAKGGTRDTDWYEIAVSDSDGDSFAQINLEICTSLPVVSYLFPNDCALLTPLAQFDAELGRSGSVTACVKAPATYWIFVAPGSLTGGIFDGFPCFSLNQYWLKTFCSEPCGVCGSAGDCCVAHNGPGCNDIDCCASVCALDQFCCGVTWDSLCANGAGTLCHDLCCPADLDGDGIVNGSDLAILLGSWGQWGTGDVNGDGIVDGADLAALLGSWGPC